MSSVEHSRARRLLYYCALFLVGLTKVAAAELPPFVSFISDFERDTQRGKWAHIQVMHLDRLSASTERTQHGKLAAKVDVRPGDNPMSCCVGSDRAELLHMRRDDGSLIHESSSSGTQYLAVSYKFPVDFKIDKAWQIILQLHGADKLSASPAFALDIKNGQFLVRTNGGDLAEGNRFVQERFFDSSLNLGYWTDIIIRIKFVSDATGHVTVWRRNESETRFRQVVYMGNIPTLQYNSRLKIPPGKHYWKQGLYRATIPVRSTFWIGPMARGKTFAAVERAAFNTNSGKP